MTNPFDLSGKVAIVTGANTGIGQAAALALAAAGADLALVGRRQPQDTMAQAVTLGRRCHFIEADLQSMEPVARIVAETLSVLGGLDILVNNAGIIRRQDSLDFTEADWDDVMNVNIKTVFFLCQAAGRHMVGQGRGKIINIASMLSFQGGIRVPSYTASKSGVAGLTKLLANEWAGKSVNVNAIAPGYIATDNTAQLRADAGRNTEILSRIPAGRWGDPVDIGGGGHVPCVVGGGLCAGAHSGRRWRMAGAVMRATNNMSGRIFRMRSKALWMAVALLAVQPALASPFAMLPPSFAKGHDKAGQDAGRAIIDRARLALKRPPAPIPVIHVEGTLPGQGIYDISDTALQDLPVALDLALAWRLTREKPFLTQAEAYIAAWAQVYKVSRNPIDETGLDALIAAYDLTGKKLSPRTRKQFDGFLRTVASGYLSDIETGNVWIYTKINNWQSHRVKLATLAAFSLGDAKLIDRAHRAFEKQVAANLRPDGSAQDFETRDALHYVVYTLEPLLVAAYAAKIHGQDWYGFHTNEGAGLQKSLDWLAQYARGEKTHIEFVKSVVAFDRQRAEAGVGTFKNQAWNPMESAQVYALASLFDPRFAGLRDTLMAKGGTVSPWIRLANRHSR